LPLAELSTFAPDLEGAAGEQDQRALITEVSD